MLRQGGCLRVTAAFQEDHIAFLVRRRLLFGTCGIALGALPHFAFGAGKTPLRVVGTRFEGVYERQADGEFSGLSVEVVRLLARRRDCAVQFEMYPWRRAQQRVSMGLADVLVGPYKSAEREQTMLFTEQPVFQDQVAFYSRAKGMVFWGGDYAALKGKRIVTLNGWSYGAAFTAAAAGLNISVANNVENGLMMLMYGHVDLFASNRRDTDPVIQRMGLTDKLLPVAPLIDRQNAYFAFPKSASGGELAGAFDQLLSELKSSGELRRMAKRHLVSVP
jgi:polar amino acid transport system substrate-binding protein